MGSRRVLPATLTLALMVAARPVMAAGDLAATLDYATDPAVADCPTAAEFRAAVAHQLGRDPFRASASRRIIARVRRAGGRLEGRVEWRDASDQWEGERTFSSRDESCTHMVRGMAFATATQIQLLAEIDAAARSNTAAGAGAAGSANAEARTEARTDGRSQPTDAAPARPPAPPEPPAPPPKAETTTPVAPPSATVEVHGPPTTEGESREPLIAVEAGIGVIEDAGDAPGIVAPRIAVTVGRPSAFGLRLAASGFGPSAQVTRPEGSAQIDRYLVTLQLVRFFRSGHLLQPFAAVGGGGQVVRARGFSTSAPTHDASAVSGLVAAGGGLGIVLAARLSVIVEVEALLYRPEVTVQVGSSDAAHLDGFGLFAHGGFLARF